MKTKLSIIALLFPFSFLLFPCTGQVPQGFNYQAIARDGTGNPIANISLPVRITIQADSAGTTVLWQEVHASVSSNSFGLINLVIGKGARQAASTVATFSAIDWSVTPKFIKTEIFYGTDYLTMGVSRLWSVPYALNAPNSNPWQLNGSSLYYAGGYVGIETSTPVTPLTVTLNNNTGITYPLYIQNASGDWTATEKGVGLKFGRLNPTSGHDYGTIMGTIASVNGGAGRLQFIGGGGTTPHMTIDNIGNVGIGSISPTEILQVGTESGGATARKAIKIASGGYSIPGAYQTNSNGDKIILYNADMFDARIGVGPTGDMWFKASGTTSTVGRFIWYNGSVPTERMRIDNTGYVGIGTPTPAYNLHVVGSARITGSLLLDGNLNAGGWNLSAYSIEVGGPSPTATNAQATIFLHHHSNVAHQLRYAYGTLFLEAAGNGYGTTTTPTFQVNGPLYAAMSGGKVGIGTASSLSKLAIQPESTWSDEVPLFEVKNKLGVPVLAVYNNGVRILVDHTIGKGIKSGFAVGGYDMTKAGKTVDFMIISPDSIRFNINNDNVKALKGGFAVGGYDATKGIINQDFMYITPQVSNNGLYNTFLGYQSGFSNNSTGNYNSFIGYNSGYGNTTGDYNVYIGYNSGKLNQSGVSNVIIGPNAGPQGTGIDNSTFVGAGAGLKTTGDQNTFIGCWAGNQNVSGQYNTYLGTYAGFANTGTANVFIGMQAGSAAVCDNKLYISNSATESPLVWGDFVSSIFRINGSIEYTGSLTHISDARLKTNIFELENVISKIGSIRAVYYDWNKETTSGMILNETRQIGVIAQEVEKAFPELVVTNEKGYKMVDYVKLTPVLLEAVKEQQQQIESQQQQIDELKALVEKLVQK
ncbi:MAG: tail fiber domain-containing protein [Bacteroidales bacterium]|jgi:hypothetical protein|nr:tail fiber domain-containing protein [Bacteroidales bacterium]